MISSTNMIARGAAVLAGLGLMASSFAFAGVAKADTTSDLQAQIAALMAQIAALQASTASSSSMSMTFTKDLTVGSSGADVTALQNALISGGFLKVAKATGYFGPLTKAAVSAWQTSKGITPAAGYFGPKSRAAFGGTVVTPTPGVPGVPVTGNGLKVMLATDSPNNVALVAGQAIGGLAKFTFSNPTSSDVKVTNLSFTRIGVSNDATLSNVYLYSGAKRLTDSAGISNGAFNFNDPTGLFTVPMGGTITVSVLADIATGTSGQQIGAKLTAVSSTGTLDSSVSLPIMGGTQTVSAATLAGVDFNSTTLPASGTVNAQTDFTVWQNTATISTRMVWLKSFQLRNMGSSDSSAITNLRLYVDGVMVGSSVNGTDANDLVTFDLSGAPVKLETGNRVIKVVGDIVAGSADTFQFSLRRASDAMVVDSDLSQPVLATANGSSFSARAPSAASTIGSGSVSVTKSNSSLSSNISVGATNVKFATFEIRATGEDVKVDNIDVQANTTLDHGLDNGKVFLNGVQVGSTKDLTDAADVNFTFGSSFLLKAGTTAIVDVYADAKTTTGAAFASGDTAAVTLGAGSSNGEGKVSSVAVNVPGSDVTANTITISSSALTMGLYSGYSNQTLIAGTTNARLGAFALSAGSTEGVTVNTITVTLSANEAASITDLVLKDDAGNTLAAAKPAPSTSNGFTVNLTIPASGSKVINVYGNIISGSNAGPWIANVDGSGNGATNSGSVTFGHATAASGSLQQITIGSGSLAAAVAAGNPASLNVIAGTDNLVGQFKFSAANSTFTVNELMVKIPAGSAASSTASVTLKYLKQGASVWTTTDAAVLAMPSGAQTEATATFTGLSFYVPTGGAGADVKVYVKSSSIGSGGSAITGAPIAVKLDWNNGFKATDSAGTAVTTVGSADLNSAASTGYGKTFVKNAIPTLARVNDGYVSDTVASGIGLYRFTITNGSVNPLEFKKISFAVSTTGVTASSFTLYESNVAVNTTAVDANSSGNVVIYAGASNDDGIQSIGGNGGSKTYELQAATVTGWGGSGDQITINFTEDSSAVTSASSASLTDNMIWSDVSADSHTTITADWTNGYLIKDTTSDTRTCSFGTVTTCNPH